MTERTKQQERLVEESGAFETSDGLVVFLYQLMRDRLPAGTVAELVRDVTENASGPCSLTNGYLGEYARFLVRELRGTGRGAPNQEVATLTHHRGTPE